MKQFFSESYTKVCLGAGHEQIEARWKGIEDYCTRDNINIYELVKIYYNIFNNKSFCDELVLVFHNIDMTFSKNNKKELSVLSGNILNYLMDQYERDDIILPLICLSKYDIDTALPVLIDNAYKTFASLSADTREREVKYKNVPTKILTDFSASLNNHSEIDSEQIKDLAKTINSIASSISALVANQTVIKKAIEVYREDSSILAWLFGNWSNELNIALTNKVPKKNVALILAKELADLVVVMPGPYPVKAFLCKMLDMCESEAMTYSLVDMVDAVDNDAKKSIVEKYNCIDGACEMTPILFSIKTAMDLNKPDVWQHTVTSLVGFEISTIQNNILDWAFMMYFECLLIKRHRM